MLDKVHFARNPRNFIAHEVMTPEHIPKLIDPVYGMRGDRVNYFDPHLVPVVKQGYIANIKNPDEGHLTHLPVHPNFKHYTQHDIAINDIPLNEVNLHYTYHDRQARNPPHVGMNQSILLNQ